LFFFILVTQEGSLPKVVVNCLLASFVQQKRLSRNKYSIDETINILLMQVHISIAVLAVVFVLLLLLGYLAGWFLQYKAERKRQRMEKEMLQIHAEILSLYARLRECSENQKTCTPVFPFEQELSDQEEIVAPATTWW